mmetsp:Transcript_43423/g.86144  ORF Transcript_43423/g.86144 Transcript_43423/m.86144 type:complete len:238 (+) Transcript_43423:78-791(+)
MGAIPTKSSAAPQVSKAHVKLHVYDAMVRADLIACNRAMMQLVGAGAFHCGVEVYGREWSFRKTRTEGTGVFCHAPLKPPGGSHLQSISMGTTALPAESFYRLMDVLAWEWPGNAYDLLDRNCVHFSQELCRRLDVAVPFPAWISKLSDAGRSIRNDGRNAAEAMADWRRVFATQKTNLCFVDDMGLCCMKIMQGGICNDKQDVEHNGSTVQIIRDSQLVTSTEPSTESSSAGIVGL